MNINQFLETIWKKKQTFASLLIAFLTIAILVSAVQPFKYGSSLNLLTVLNLKETTDPYTVSKSNDYLSNLLARIVSSNSFYEQVMSSGFNVDQNYFSGSDKQKMKKWARTVTAKSVADTGVISINVYHTNRAQAEEIARAVAYVLETDNAQYHGFGDSVTIKEIDKPITSTFPVKPDIVLNLSLGLAFSVLFFLCYIYLFPEEKYDVRLWPKKRNRIKVASVEKINYDVYQNRQDNLEEEAEYENIEEDIKEKIKARLAEAGIGQFQPRVEDKENLTTHGDINNLFRK